MGAGAGEYFESRNIIFGRDSFFKISLHLLQSVMYLLSLQSLPHLLQSGALKL